MHKCILMLAMLFIISLNLFSAVLEISEVRNSEDRVVFDFGKASSDYAINYDEIGSVIFIEFINTKPPKNLKIENIKNEFVEKVEEIQFENNTDFFIYLKPDTGYKAYKVKDPNRVVVEFYQKNNNKPKKPLIVIDAGHGGKDSGAVGYQSIMEKELNLKLAKLAAERLKSDFEIKLTRDEDVFIALPDRPKVANDINADLFVSFHFNAIPDNENANGIEVFYYSRNPDTYGKLVANIENSVDEKYGVKTQVTDLIVSDLFYHVNQEKSIPLAKLFIDSITDKTGFSKRPKGGVYGQNFSVLRNSKVPSVLVEFGFLTNKKEALKCKDEEYQAKMIEGVYEALKKYFEK